MHRVFIICCILASTVFASQNVVCAMTIIESTGVSYEWLEYDPASGMNVSHVVTQPNAFPPSSFSGALGSPSGSFAFDTFPQRYSIGGDATSGYCAVNTMYSMDVIYEGEPEVHFVGTVGWNYDFSGFVAAGDTVSFKAQISGIHYDVAYMNEIIEGPASFSLPFKGLHISEFTEEFGVYSSISIGFTHYPVAAAMGSATSDEEQPPAPVSYALVTGSVVVTVPEPSSLCLGAFGLAGIGACACRRRKC